MDHYFKMFIFRRNQWAKSRIQFYAMILIVFALGCGDGSVPTIDLQDTSMVADVGDDLSHLFMDTRHDVESMDVGEEASNDSGVQQDECNLEDNIPDDCYQVPALTRESAQLGTRVQANARPSWNCNADPHRFVFDAYCFPDGSLNFPSGNWRNVIFHEGKIMSIEFVDPTLFEGLAQVFRDSVSWVGVGTYGNYDVSISRIPGDLSDNLPEACIRRNGHSPIINIENAAHAVSDSACWLEADKTYYLNIYLVPGTCDRNDEGFTKCSHTFTGRGDAGW